VILKSSVHRALMLGVMLVAFAVAAPSAGAAVTSSSISSPADRFVALYNDDTDVGSMTVAGSATGAPGDKVDIVCTSGTTNDIFASNVDVVGGQFSVTATLSSIVYKTCVLHAIPAGSSPPDLSPFTGPVIGVSLTSSQSSGGTLWDYYIWPAQFSGNFDFDSAGRCGVDDSYLFDVANSYKRTAVVYYCNQWLTVTNHSPNAAAIQVDGQSAYASSAPGLNFAALPGYQPITYSFSQAANGDAKIIETTPILFCSTGIAPPLTTATCPGFTDSGVRLNRTMEQDHDGLVAVVADDFVSTNGAPHSISLSYRQSHCLGRPGCVPKPQFTFPGGAPITNPANGDVLSTSLPAASTIYAANPNVADGDVTAGRGALTIYPAADSAVALNARDFQLNYDGRTVPATGSLHITAIFSQAYGQAQLDGLAAEAAKRITPQPTFAAPLKATAKYDKKKKKTVYKTGQSVNCPATGIACAITASLATTVKLPAKKSKKHSKKKAKPRYKTYKFGTIALNGIPGSVTPVEFTLSKTASKLLQTYKKLKFTTTLEVTAGPNASASSTTSATVKAPKLPKPKKHKKK
jgi:hypothetical protein